MLSLCGGWLREKISWHRIVSFLFRLVSKKLSLRWQVKARDTKSGIYTWKQTDCTASLAGGIFRTMETRLFFFFFFQGGTIRVVAGLSTASLSLYHIGCGIEPGRTSAQHGNWKINGYKLYRIGFGREVSVVPLKLPYSSGCVGLRVYSMRKLTFRYIHVKHKRAEDYRLLPCKLKFSNHMCWAKIKIWMRSATLVRPQ